jgi:hypothetical protein
MTTTTNLEVDRTFKYQFYHRENSTWLTSLSFYKDEITYFSGLLSNVKEKNTSLEISNEIFVFERELSNLQSTIEGVTQSIIEEEWGFDDDATGKDFLLGEEIYSRHVGIRERFQETEKTFLDTKHRLYRFLCKAL